MYLSCYQLFQPNFYVMGQPSKAKKPAAKKNVASAPKKELQELREIRLVNVQPDHREAVEKQLRAEWKKGVLDAESIEASLKIEGHQIEGSLVCQKTSEGVVVDFYQN